MGLRLLLDVGARRTGGCIKALSEQSIFMVGEAARDESTELFAERAASAPLLPSCAEIELLSAFTFCMVRSRLLSFRNGQRVIPCARQIFFSDVRHMPICCATCFSGKWKKSESSSSVIDVGGIAGRRDSLAGGRSCSGVSGLL